MSQNEVSTMPEESDAGTSSRHQKEDIFGKYEDKEYSMIQTIWMKIMKTIIILEKKQQVDHWYMLVNGAHKCLQNTFDEAVHTTVKDNPDIA